MADTNSINSAIEQFQKQLLDIQQMYYPSIIDQINLIDLKQIFGPWEETLLKLTQSNISLALTQWAEQMDRIAKALEPQISHIVLSSSELSNKLDNILPYLQEELVEVKKLNYENFSEDEIKEFDNIANTVTQISDITKSNKLTIGDLFSILSFLTGIIFSILGIMPNQQLEQLHQDNQILIQQNEDEAIRNEKLINIISDYIELLQQTVDENQKSTENDLPSLD